MPGKEHTFWPGPIEIPWGKPTEIPRRSPQVPGMHLAWPDRLGSALPGVLGLTWLAAR